MKLGNFYKCKQSTMFRTQLSDDGFVCTVFYVCEPGEHFILYKVERAPTVSEINRYWLFSIEQQKKYYLTCEPTIFLLKFEEV